jgi:hypothetical protein
VKLTSRKSGSAPNDFEIPCALRIGGKFVLHFVQSNQQQSLIGK